MKIRHYAVDWPSTLKIPLTTQENSFFRFLELSDEFEKRVSSIRGKYDMPKNGFSYDRENEIGLEIPKYLDFDKWNDYLEDVERIADDFGFTSSWQRSLYYFINFNLMPKMNEIIVPRAAIFDGEKALLHLQNDYPALLKRKVLISISQKLSKKQLKDLIDLQWDQISEQMKILPKWDQKKHKSIDKFKVIDNLMKQKNMTWGKMMSLLSDKYPSDSKFLDEPYLRNLYSRYKKRLNKIPKTPISLSSPTK